LQLFTPLKTRSDHPDRIRDGFISMGHGRAIINIEDLDIQTDIYQRIVSQNLSVRDTEALVKKLSGKSKTETSGQNKARHQHLKFKKLKKRFY
jgi:ParB-like chromosome segregation protein Spo0J